jgi:hypothetical protein
MDFFKFCLVAAPTFGLAADVATHLAATWIIGFKNLYYRLLFGAFWGGVVTLALTLWAGVERGLPAGEIAAYAVFNTFTLLVLSFGYFNLVQMNLSSLRLRIANELHDTPEGITPERLLEMYGAHEIVDQRLARLSRGAQIECRDGRYYCRMSTVYLISVAMDTTKRLVLGRRIRDSFRRKS